MMRLKRRSPARQSGAWIVEAGMTSISLIKTNRKLRLAQALLAAQLIPPEAITATIIVAGEVRP